MSKVDEIMVLAQEYGIYYSAWDRLPNKGRKAALDEKSQELRNAIEALAQPAGEAEPVAQWQKKHPWRTDGRWENTDEHDAKWWRDNAKGWEIRALYTAPQQSQPLTDEQIEFLKFMDLLRVHHKTIEAWMLEQAGVEFTPLEQRKLAVAK